MTKRFKTQTFLLLFVLVASMMLATCTQPGPAPAPQPSAVPAGETPAGVGPQEPAATEPPAATPTPAPSPTPTIQPLDLPPVAVATSPERGEEQPLDAPIVVRFDQPMDEASTSGAFAIEPQTEGAVEIKNTDLVFTPQQPLARGESYRVTVSQDAKSSEGEPLAAPVDLRFNAVGFLEVTSTQPADGNQEVSVDSPITVVFNRPVVPLTGVDQQAGLPQPLVIEPETAGAGKWLNTSIYTFTPERALAGGAKYIVTVKAGLEDTVGGLLAEDYVFSFTTASPLVTAFRPEGEQVAPGTPVTVTFSQPMDQPSTQAAFSLTDDKTNQPVSGSFSWHEDGRVMAFQPSSALTFATPYVARVGTDARSAAGEGTLREPYVARFNVAPKIGVVETTPADGATGVPVEREFAAKFQGVVDEKTLGPDAFTILPEPTQVYSYFNSYENRYVISWPVQPQTAYRVTLSGKIGDIFGNTLGEDVAVRFRTGDRKPFAHLNVPNEVGTYNAYTNTLIAVSYRNVDELNFNLYSVSEADAERMLGPNGWDVRRSYTPSEKSLIREWSESVAPKANTNTLTKFPLAEDGGPLAPGLYWLEMRAPGVKYGDGSPDSGQLVPRHLLIVSPFNLIAKKGASEILVWATDLKSGKPVPSVPIRVRGPATAEGITDADGIFRAPISQKEPWQPVVVFAGTAGSVGSVGDRPQQGTSSGRSPTEPAQYGAMSTDWQQGLGPWDYNLPGEFPPPTWQGYFYTDRPIYRPDQTVYWKGILRADNDAIYQVPPPGTKVKVVIRNEKGETIYDQVHETNAFGTVNGELALPQEAGLGFYYLEGSLPEADPSASYQPTFGLGFQVAEYRKPEFLVEMTADKDQVLQGETINATVQANFFFGGPVSDAKVQWTAFSQDAYFNYTGDTKGRWYSFNDYVAWDPTQSQSGGSIGNGSGVTDSQGKYSIQIPADIGDKTNSQRFTIDARTTDLTNQEVATSVAVLVHKGLIYPGVAPRSYISPVGEPSTVDLIAVDWDSKPVANQEITVGVSKAEWRNVQKKGEDGQFYWTTEVDETPVLTDTVTTGANGEAVFTWTPEEGGQYKINASVVDTKGNTVRSSAFVWASETGDAYVSWRVDNNDRITLVADKPLYQVGDTAQVLVPHPFQGPVDALLTIERGSIIEAQHIVLNGNSETLAIPITEDFVPDVFVSVAIVKGQGDGDELGSFKLGYVKLPVDTVTKKLQITLTPNATELKPGETVTFTMQVNDYAGQPVQAEFSLALIDKALLSLVTEQPSSLLDTFYRERGLGIQTASTLVMNLDRLNSQLQEGAKGGGGGGGMAGVDVRTEFEDTALWEPTVTTDAAGKATVSVKLPDNLTTWQLDGRGVTVDTEVGQATVEIRTTLPLLVRPVLPRFFTSGDRAEIGAVVNNNTDAPRTVNVIMAAQGVTTTAPLTQTVTVGPGGQAKVSWPVEVPAPATEAATGEARIRFGAIETGAPAGKALGDAVETTLPIYRYASPETVATAGTVALNEERTEVIVLPPNVDPTQGDLRVQLDPSLAAGTIQSLAWLEHFPYECNEQIISKFLPNVVSYQALALPNAAGLRAEDADELKADLEEQIATGLQKLLQGQNPDGGWGWWSGEESNAFVSSYVVFGLVKAQQAGFSVDQGAIDRGVGYLKQQLKPIDDLEGWELNQQAFILYVLAEAGQGDTGRSVALYDVRERLAHYGQAWLALDFGRLDEQGEPTAQDRIQVLLDDLTSSAIVSATGAHWEEKTTDWWTMNTNVRSTALALDALAKLDPKNALAPNVVRWLMVARQDGAWQTTQENAWAVMALTDWMAATGELNGDYSYNVTLNAGELVSGTVTPQNVDEPVELRVAVSQMLLDAANGLTIRRFAEGSQSGEGQLYYTTYLNYYLPAADLEPLDRGIVVDRQYTVVDPVTGKPKPGVGPNEAQVGDTIQVTMTLIAPNDLHYLVLESPLPAGAEAIDTSLATTSQVYQGPEINQQPVEEGDKTQPPVWWWLPTQSELRDEKVALFATELPAGTYQYTYQIRASLPGQFQVLPATAYEMYFPEVWGRSAGELYTISGQ